MNKKIEFKFDWLTWFLILLPTFYVINKDLRHVQMNFFQISVILMLAVLHVNRWYGLFLGWATFQMLFFQGSPDQSVVIQNIFFAGLLYHFITKYVVDCKKYFKVFVWILAINVVWCVFQYFQIDPIFNQANPQHQTIFSEYSGFFAIPSFLGNYAAVVATLCLFINPLLLFFVVPAIIVSKSSFSMLAVCGGLLFYLWFKKRIVFWIALFAIVFAGSFYILKYDAPSGQFGRRIKLWGMVLKEGFKDQFFGHGIGTYNTKYAFVEITPEHTIEVAHNDSEIGLMILNRAIKNGNAKVSEYMVGKNIHDIDLKKLKSLCQNDGFDFEEWGHPHNELILVFFEMGLFGVFIVFGFIFNLFRRFFLAKKDDELLALMSCFVAIVIVSMAHFPFYVARLAGPFIVIIALLETKLLRSEDA